MSEPTTVLGAIEATLTSIKSAQERPTATRQGSRLQLSEWVRINVLIRDGFRCRWCSASGTDAALHVDHITAWSAFGSDATDNLRALCQPCNLSRSNRETDTKAARALLITNGCNECCANWYGDDRDIGDTPVWCAWCQAPSITSASSASSYRDEQSGHFGYGSKDAKFTSPTKARFNARMFRDACISCAGGEHENCLHEEPMHEHMPCPCDELGHSWD